MCIPTPMKINIDIAKLNMTLLCPQIGLNLSCVKYFNFLCLISLLCVRKSRLRKKGVEDEESLMSLMSSLTKILPLNPLRQSSFTLGNFKTLLLIFFIKLVKQTSLLLDIHYFNGPRHSYHFNLYSMNGFFVIIEFLSSACERKKRSIQHKTWPI